METNEGTYVVSELTESVQQTFQALKDSLAEGIYGQAGISAYVKPMTSSKDPRMVEFGVGYSANQLSTCFVRFQANPLYAESLDSLFMEEVVVSENGVDNINDVVIGAKSYALPDAFSAAIADIITFITTGVVPAIGFQEVAVVSNSTPIQLPPVEGEPVPPIPTDPGPTDPDTTA